MVDLFNENTLFVLFFAMVAIYNYSALKEYQRMAIIYISIYALAALFFLNLVQNAENKNAKKSKRCKVVVKNL